MKVPYVPEKILVALAFTDDPFATDFRIVKGDQDLLERATWFAGLVGASLTLIHVIEGEDHTLPFHDRSAHEVLKSRAVPLLEEAVDKIAAQGVEVSYKIDEGVGSQRLMSEAKLGEYHLIMAGFNRHEDDLVDYLFHGSTTKKLLRYSPVPVWANSAHHENKLERLLVPVDFSKTSAKTVAIANALSEKTGAQKILLHCASYPGLMSARRMPNADEAVAEYIADVKERIHKQIEELLGDEYESWEVLVTDHNVVKAVEHYADKKDVDLVIMGTIARTGLAGFLVGNTAEKVLGELSAPVWAVKPEGWSF